MGRTNNAELARLFSHAEREETCLVPSSPRIRESLRRQLEREKAVRPARGMYARSPYWHTLSKSQQALHILRTMQKLHPHWTFCRESAAIAFGLPVAFESPQTVHVATSKASRTSSSGIVAWHIVENDRPVIVQGLRVTSLTRTVFDCMRTADFGQALATADGALRLSGDRPRSFISSFSRIGGNLPGANKAVRTMLYADARSESGGESIARAAMIQQGFAIPQLQVAFPQPLDRRRTFRVDFLWTRLDGSHVMGEFDGMQKYEDEAMRGSRSALRVLADEQHRESQLTLYSMPIVRFSYKDVMNAASFAHLLKQYGIPQSDEVARSERRLARYRSSSAQIFVVENLNE